MDEERALIAKASKGDKNSFEKLVLKYQKRLHGFVFNILGNEEASLDVVQESFIKAYCSLKSFKLDKVFSTWLFTIAKNTAFNYIKTNKKYELKEAEENVSLDNNPEESYMKKESKKALINAIDALSEKYKVLIHLKYMEKMSYLEISEKLAIPISVVESRLYTARQKLSNLLKG